MKGANKTMAVGKALEIHVLTRDKGNSIPVPVGVPRTYEAPAEISPPTSLFINGTLRGHKKLWRHRQSWNDSSNSDVITRVYYYLQKIYNTLWFSLSFPKNQAEPETPSSISSKNSTSIFLRRCHAEKLQKTERQAPHQPFIKTDRWTDIFDILHTELMEPSSGSFSQRRLRET